MSHDPAFRTYRVADERLRAFRALTPAQRLQWVEELAQFVRLARASRRTMTHAAASVITQPDQS